MRVELLGRHVHARHDAEDRAKGGVRAAVALVAHDGVRCAARLLGLPVVPLDVGVQHSRGYVIHRDGVGGRCVGRAEQCRFPSRRLPRNTLARAVSPTRRTLGGNELFAGLHSHREADVEHLPRRALAHRPQVEREQMLLARLEHLRLVLEVCARPGRWAGGKEGEGHACGFEGVPLTLAEQESLARCGGRRVLRGAAQGVDDCGATLDLRRTAGCGRSASGTVCKGVSTHGRGEGYAPSLRARAV